MTRWSETMKTGMRSAAALAALAILFTGVGCQPPPNSGGPINAGPVAPSGTPAPAPAPPPPTPKTSDEATNLPVTLPVLDALFYDESFKAELKSKAHLTDEEIQKVRTIAHDATSKLREADED